ADAFHTGMEFRRVLFRYELWAQVWSDLGARWEETARKAETGGNQSEAKEAYLKSYGYYGIARHPFPSTPGKQRAYLKAREMHLEIGRASCRERGDREVGV